MGYFVNFRNAGWEGSTGTIEQWKLGGYMTASDNGVGIVRANVWSPGYWEVFGINVIENGPLVHGAEIILRSNGDPPTNKPGAWVDVRLLEGGGRVLDARDAIEHFLILKVGGQTGYPIHDNDLIFLVTSTGHRVKKTTESGPVVAADDASHSQWRLKIL